MHVRCSKLEKHANNVLYRSINSLPSRWDGIRLVLVKSFPCSNIDELEARELHHMKKLDANLNVRMPKRTGKEYY
jgi:hypothetical protein